MQLSIVWLLLAVAAGVGIFMLGDTCEVGESCSGLSRSVRDNAVAYLIVIIAVGLAGYFGLQRFDRDREIAETTRPCPRCGERVAIGELDCPHCDFDFRTIGGDQEHAVERGEDAPADLIGWVDENTDDEPRED